LEARINQNPHHMLLTKIKDLETALEQSTTTLTEAKTREKSSLKKCDELEEKIKDFEKNKDSHMKAVESTVTTAKSDLTALTKKLKHHQQEVEKVALEYEELQNEIKTTQEQLKEATESITKAKESCEKYGELTNEKKKEYEIAKADLDKKRDKMMQTDKTVSHLIVKREALSKEASDVDVDNKKLEHKIQRFHKDQKEASKFVETMENKHQWISIEKTIFW